MKKFLVCVSLLSVLLTSCGGDSGNEGLIIPPGCSVSITSFTAQQNADKIIFNISAQPGALYYEASICPTGMCSGPGGTTIPLDVQTNSISIAGFPYTGDMVVHLRSVCPDNSRSAWVGPIIVSVQEYCGTPETLQFLGNQFYWNYNTSMPQVSNYQVQYGPQGFELGSGTTATVNNSPYSGAMMEAGQTYDFYVRAYCSNGLGYGNWAGPYTHYSQGNQNLCLPPTNIAGSYTGGAHQFTFDPNGEQKWEYTIVIRDYDISTGTLYTRNWNQGFPAFNLNINYEWDFYIRAICSNGDRTAWVKYQYNP